MARPHCSWLVAAKFKRTVLCSGLRLLDITIKDAIRDVMKFEFEFDDV